MKRTLIACEVEREAYEKEGARKTGMRESVMYQVRREAATRLPESLDYATIAGLSMEAIETLEQHKPLSLAAASR